jgi:hypothetical protein
VFEFRTCLVATGSSQAGERRIVASLLGVRQSLVTLAWPLGDCGLGIATGYPITCQGRMKLNSMRGMGRKFFVGPLLSPLLGCSYQPTVHAPSTPLVHPLSGPSAQFSDLASSPLFQFFRVCLISLRSEPPSKSPRGWSSPSSSSGTCSRANSIERPIASSGSVASQQGLGRSLQTVHSIGQTRRSGRCRSAHIRFQTLTPASIDQFIFGLLRRLDPLSSPPAPSSEPSTSSISTASPHPTAPCRSPTPHPLLFLAFRSPTTLQTRRHPLSG